MDVCKSNIVKRPFGGNEKCNLRLILNNKHLCSTLSVIRESYFRLSCTFSVLKKHSLQLLRNERHS